MRRIPQLTIRILQSSVQSDSPYPHGASRLTPCASRLAPHPSRFPPYASRPTPYHLRVTDKGFTLIEVIVILAVISILVAILTPTVLKFIEDAQRSSASDDVRVIAAALNDLIKDTGQFPGDKVAGGETFLCSPGDFATDPTGTWATSAGVCSDLFNHLIINDPDGNGTPNESSDYRTTGRRRHRGLYLSSVEDDPFATRFQVNVDTLVGGNTAVTWVITAGPDGEFQTAATATTLSGDDIGIRIK